MIKAWMGKLKVKKQLMEKMPLPVGRAEFDEWSDRIISGTMLPTNPKLYRSQKGGLCAMLLAMGPTEAFKEDAYFIQALRKGAVNEVASAIFQELKAEIRQEALVEEQNKEASEAQSTKSEETPTENGVTHVVLEHQTV